MCEIPILRVVLIEDEEMARRAVRRILEPRCLICEAVDLQEAEDNGPERPDVILLDLGLSSTWGTETVRQAAQTWPWVPIVVWTGRDELELHADCVLAGASDVLIKGRDEDRLLSAVVTAWARREARAPRAVVRMLASAIG